MPKIWRNRIIAGDKTFEKCPSIYKSSVKALLRQDVEDGVISSEEFEEFVGERYEA